MIESAVREELADGRLVQLLDAWCQPFEGFFLYYPSQRQVSGALLACIDFVRLSAGDQK